MTKEKLFYQLLSTDSSKDQRNIIMTPDNDLLNLLEELEKDGMVLRCDRIPGVKFGNNSYTYVTNDEAGIEQAKRWSNSYNEYKSICPSGL